MKATLGLIVIGIMFASCGTTDKPETSQSPLPIVGTWQLISGTTIEKGDTTVTDYTKNLSFIKVINNTHFAFVKHDLTKGKGPSPDFGAGGGRYSLKDSVYTEHLEYCNDRQWEGNDFSFVLTLTNDTLTQRGVETVKEAGVNRVNIETYSRVKD